MNAENPIVKIEVGVKLLDIAYLLCSAMEGGINYWAAIVGYEGPDELSYTLDGLSGVNVEERNVYRHIDYLLNDGGVVYLRDVEAGRDVELKHADLARGLAVMYEKYPKHFADVVNENTDADTGDVFIQCCLFGDVIYG